MREYILDTLASGVKTTEELDGEPYGFRVSWIGWNSGFRGSDLRLGDVVVACGEMKYAREHRKAFVHLAFGSYSESQHWQNVGARDAHAATVTVKRGSRLLDVVGTVRAERNWQNERGRYTLGPGGPERLANDGFQSTWAMWLEGQIEDIGARVLDGGWRRGTVHDNRRMLDAHLGQRERVAFLAQKYPGPFASAVAADWEHVRAALEGPRYEIAAHELAWRALGDQRKCEVAAAARVGRDDYLASLAPELIAAFPAVDPVRGDRAAVAGKLVLLPRLANRNWTMDAGRAWLIAADRSGSYFLDSHSDGMRRAFMARWRYEKAVSPYLDETYEIIGRIGPDPKMLVVNGVAVTGLLVEPVAVTIGDAVFVDVSAEDARFAGESALAATGALALEDAAGPEAVMRASVLALKLGNEAFWKGLFAPWDAARIEGQVWYQPFSGAAASNSLDSEWVRARRLLAKQVVDIKVVAVDEVSTVMTPDAFEGAPLVERTRVEVDHVGLFEGEHRPFKDVNVTRLWPMQRRDGGPWRITHARGI